MRYTGHRTWSITVSSYIPAAGRVVVVDVDVDALFLPVLCVSVCICICIYRYISVPTYKKNEKEKSLSVVNISCACTCMYLSSRWGWLERVGGRHWFNAVWCGVVPPPWYIQYVRLMNYISNDRHRPIPIIRTESRPVPSRPNTDPDRKSSASIHIHIHQHHPVQYQRNSRATTGVEKWSDVLGDKGPRWSIHKYKYKYDDDPAQGSVHGGWSCHTK